MRLAEHAPGLAVAGVETPPYRDLDDAELDELGRRIRRAGAGIVWVGIGTPRQDRLVPELAARVPAAIVPVGAAFDFHAGTKPTAPGWMQNSGLEWLFRLTTEPRRLWRRYLVTNSIFVFLFARRMLAGR